MLENFDRLDIGKIVYFPVYRSIHKKHVARKNPQKHTIYHGEVVEMTDTHVVIRTKRPSLHNRPIDKIALSKQRAKKIEL